MINGRMTKLRDKTLDDARDDYIWQADPELARLDAVPPLSSTFADYLSVYVSELRYMSSIRRQFSIETQDGKHIGNCTYYNINQAKGEAELGVIIGNRDYWDKGYGADAVTTLLSYIFRQTALKRIYLKTLEWNTRARKCFQKCGFTACGCLVRDGYNFVLMEIHRKQWQERHQSPEADDKGEEGLSLGSDEAVDPSQ